MSAKKKTIIVAVIVVLAVAFIAVAFLATQKSADYYTQIDNDCVTEIAPHGAMNYRYTLNAYDETGAEKELSFETSRILTDDAYLCRRWPHSVVSLPGQKCNLMKCPPPCRNNTAAIRKLEPV